MGKDHVMTRFLKALCSSRSGTTTIEYGVICMTIFLAILSAVQGVTDETNGLWATVTSKSIEAMSHH